ncbi:BTB/POZ and MATH domain-containing protein 1 [Rhynchospora pubera]|uniref:BTB/POZ and MATH domain-containing protein 1 n=1 Tax=Rhynchospora pubera TaxID=906938 RepID=A0AAV8EWW2_9POAL|nr:BTB/POZ and MATH domain-containing protein 1 [Rhynchospora pubera]
MSLSTGTSVHTAPTASTWRAEQVVGSHLFKIEEYSTARNTEKGNFLESDTFNVGGYDWSIKYFPSGTMVAEDDHASIFICLKSPVDYVQAEITLEILVNQNGNMLSQGQLSAFATFKSITDTSDCGYSNFVRRSELESVLNDNSVGFKCSVCVSKVLPVESDFPLPVPPPIALQQISNLLETGIGADVTFEVNGHTFKAHKSILVARSKVFEAQFSGPCKEKTDTIIKIEDMEAVVFKELLHYIYSETIPAFSEMNDSEEKNNLAQHLLVAADRYDVERLRIICEDILYGSINKDNVVALLSIADMHNCINLKTACFKFLATPGIIPQLFESGKLKLIP